MEFLFYKVPADCLSQPVMLSELTRCRDERANGHSRPPYPASNRQSCLTGVGWLSRVVACTSGIKGCWLVTLNPPRCIRRDGGVTS